MYSVYSVSSIFNSPFRDIKEIEEGLTRSYESISEDFIYIERNN